MSVSLQPTSLPLDWPEWAKAFDGKPTIVLAVPSGMSTFREFFKSRGLKYQTYRKIGSARGAGSRPGHPMWSGFATRVSWAWKRRGDYRKIRLRIGSHPYFHYVGVYPVDIMDEALERILRQRARA